MIAGIGGASAPEVDEARRRVLAACATLPRGLGYRFTPAERALHDPINPRDPEHDGVSADIVVDGEVVARAAPDGATFCCGVTFEVWWRALGEPVRGWRPDDVRALIDDWFCPTMGHAGAVAALVSRGLGDAVALQDARPGDLCQFWRSVELSRPSGHSVVFLSLRTDPEGRRVLRYWSSQASTGGVGEREEPVGPGWSIACARPRLLQDRAPTPVTDGWAPTG